MSTSSIPPANDARFKRGTIGWYRANFGAATYLANLAATLPASDPNRRRLWLRSAGKVSDLLTMHDVAPALPETDSEGKELRAYWRAVRLPSIVLAAGVIVVLAPPRRPSPEETEAGSLADNLRYVLAIVESRLVEVGILHDADDDDDADETDAPHPASAGLRASIEQILANWEPPKDLFTTLAALIQNALDLSSPDALHGAGEMPSLDFADRIVRHVEFDRDQTPQTRYNIACYWTMRGDDDSAFEHLSAVVALSPSLAAAALTDPTFTPLHNDKRWEQFLPKKEKEGEKEDEKAS